MLTRRAGPLRALRRSASRHAPLTTLAAIAQKITRDVDLASVLDSVCTAAAALFDAEVGIRLRDGNDLRRVAATSGALLAMPRERIRVGDSISGRVAATGQAIISTDVMTDQRRLPDDRAASVIAPYAALLCAPIRYGEAVLGTLHVYRERGHRFDHQAILLAETFAAHAAIAVRNAQLFREADSRRERLELLLDVTRHLSEIHDLDRLLQTIAETCARLVDSNSVGVRVLEGSDLVLVGHWGDAKDIMIVPRLKVGHSLSGRVAETRQPLMVADVADDPRVESSHIPSLRSSGHKHWLGVPITIGDRLLGVLSVRSPRSEPFSQLDLDIATAFAAQVAILLDNTRLLSRERELNQLKSDFVSFVTHQLRTPLSAIRWTLELAKEEKDVPVSALAYLADAHRAAERLIGLVNELLDTARLERGGLRIERQRVDLAALSGQIIEELRGLIDEKHQTVERVATDAASLDTDLNLVRQVILNLVSNAIKYTPDRGRITVRVDRQGGVLKWQVDDTGVGIPAAAQAHLFEKFYRADNVAETEGTGLGLYIVRLIIEQLGGRVWCESIEGQGSTFAFVLPAS